MKNQGDEGWAYIFGAFITVGAIITVKIGFWIAMIWAIVKLVQHFAG